MLARISLASLVQANGRGGTVALADPGDWSGRCIWYQLFAGFRFPREMISLAVRWYVRYGLSYRVGLDYSIWPGQACGLRSSLRDLLRRLPARAPCACWVCPSTAGPVAQAADLGQP